MRCNLSFARLNPTEQTLDHLAESALGSLREGVYRLQVIHREQAKLDMADVNFVPQRHCRNEIAFDLSVRKAKCSQPGASSVARPAISGRRKKYFKRLRQVQDDFGNKLTCGGACTGQPAGYLKVVQSSSEATTPRLGKHAHSFPSLCEPLLLLLLSCCSEFTSPFSQFPPKCA